MILPSRKKFDQKVAIETLKKSAERWPSSFVPRSQVPKFTGGLLSAGTCANRDSEGNFVEGAFRIGRQVCYPVDKLVDYLISRLEG